jgi:hypothetical protein
MTKTEVLAKLGEKFEANRAEVRRQVEFIANLPGWEIHHENRDLLHQVSVTWKEGQALREIAAELVGLVFEDDAPAQQRAEARPS